MNAAVFFSGNSNDTLNEGFDEKRQATYSGPLDRFSPAFLEGTDDVPLKSNQNETELLKQKSRKLLCLSVYKSMQYSEQQ